jgi:hypothetical protein
LLGDGKSTGNSAAAAATTRRLPLKPRGRRGGCRSNRADDAAAAQTAPTMRRRLKPRRRRGGRLKPGRRRRKRWRLDG